MAKLSKPFAIGTLVAVIAGGSLLLMREPPTSADTSTISPTLAPPPAAHPPLPVADLASQPLVKAYLAYTDFQQHSRGFFQSADQLSDQEKQAQLRQLMDGTNKYEQEGKLVPMEALVLKLAMLRYSASGDDDYKAKAKVLIDQYKAFSDAREQAWLANPDPKFIDYKRQENDIVKEVLAMTVIPDGLSRDEYLRLRLEQARIATMGAGATGP